MWLVGGQLLTLVVWLSLVMAGMGDVPPPDHKKVRRDDKSAPLEIDNTDWWWVPIVVLALFASFMLMTRKLACLKGQSVRMSLLKYISVETLYSTLKGAGDHEYNEQFYVEIGHLVFQMLGGVLLLLNWIFNENRDARYAMAALTSVQCVLLFACTIIDFGLVRYGFLQTVRSINTKLRWSHCIYQVVLFTTDAIGNNYSMHLPVDCFIWATMHYSYEAVGLALEGLNVIGMSEMSIIALVNAKLLLSVEAATGWACAFGLSSLALSSLSLVVALVFKLYECVHSERYVPGEHDHLDEALSPDDFGSLHNRSSASHGVRRQPTPAQHGEQRDTSMRALQSDD